MDRLKYNLLLADDDLDDCTFFREALDDLALEASLETVNDGAELMFFLTKKNQILPDALFLDLNMPRTSGFECLSEIKSIEELKHLPIIIFSTSMDRDVVDMLYDKGANYYIRKPGEFSALKEVILKAINVIKHNNLKQPSKDQFIIQP